MEQELVDNGKPVFRWQELLVRADEVQIGDLFLGLFVTRSRPENSWSWDITAKNEQGNIGAHLEVSPNHLLQIARQFVVMKGECKVCGEQAKYRNLCAAHYQAQRRAALRTPGPGESSINVPLPFD